MKSVSIVEAVNPIVAQREIMRFISEFLSRFQCYSVESFADEYDDKDKAREFFETYYELITVALGMSGAPGYSRPAPTDREVREQIERQRKLRADLLALDESNFTENSG